MLEHTKCCALRVDPAYVPAGRLPCSSAEEQSQWQILSERLEEVAGSVERLILVIQDSSETEGGREALEELQRTADSLSKIFRKLVLE